MQASSHIRRSFSRVKKVKENPSSSQAAEDGNKRKWQITDRVSLISIKPNVPGSPSFSKIRQTMRRKMTSATKSAHETQKLDRNDEKQTLAATPVPQSSLESVGSTTAPAFVISERSASLRFRHGTNDSSHTLNTADLQSQLAANQDQMSNQWDGNEPIDTEAASRAWSTTLVRSRSASSTGIVRHASITAAGKRTRSLRSCRSVEAAHCPSSLVLKDLSYLPYSMGSPGDNLSIQTSFRLSAASSDFSPLSYHSTDNSSVTGCSLFEEEGDGNTPFTFAPERKIHRCCTDFDDFSASTTSTFSSSSSIYSNDAWSESVSPSVYSISQSTLLMVEPNQDINTLLLRDTTVVSTLENKHLEHSDRMSPRADDGDESDTESFTDQIVYDAQQALGTNVKHLGEMSLASPLFRHALKTSTPREKPFASRPNCWSSSDGEEKKKKLINPSVQIWSRGACSDPLLLAAFRVHEGTMKPLEQSRVALRVSVTKRVTSLMTDDKDIVDLMIESNRARKGKLWSQQQDVRAKLRAMNSWSPKE